MKQKMNIPIFIPHYGCPNDCVFCNQRKISGKDSLDNEEAIRETIEEYLTGSQGKQVEIAFFGGSFTGLELGVQKAYLDLANEYVQSRDLLGIRMSTRPDYINDEVIKLLKEYPITLVELGVQSLNEEVLSASKRRHSKDDVYKALKLLKKAEIKYGVQMMIGLPKDTEEKAMETAKELADLQPETIRIYPTLVIEDTELARMYRQGKYQPLSLEQAVTLVAKMLPFFENQKVRIIRVGLQDTDLLRSEGIIGGPYHPAFKELVLDELFYHRVMDIMAQRVYVDIKHSEGKGIANDTNSYLVRVSESLFARAIGHKKNNLKRFKNHQIWIEKDLKLPKDYLQIDRIQGGTVFTGIL